MTTQTLRVDGAQKLALLGKAVRKMGADRTIIKNLTKRVKVLGNPIKAELASSAVATLPKRGGLGAWVAKSRVLISVRRGTNTAGVSIRDGRNSAGGRSDLVSIDAGSVRHPTFGNRRSWTVQAVTPGFATRVIEGPAVDMFRMETLAAIDESIQEVLSVLQ